MASSTASTFVNLDVYYEGIFVPKPLVYFDPLRKLLTGLDLNKMDFKDFHVYIRNAIKDRCRDMYYCLPDRALVDGLRELKDKDDYVRFLDATYSNDGKINIYIDHAGEDIMEWIQEEKDEEGDVDSVLSDDVDSVLLDDVSVDHEVDDEVIQISSSVDHFLSRNNLIPAGGVGDEVEDSVYAVDLEESTCGCRSWQLTGIPCVHGIAAILFLNGNPEDYVAVWFQTKVFSSCYKYTIEPINGTDMWPKVDAHIIFPPKRRRLPGRPKVSRKKCPSEKKGRHTVTKKGVVPKRGNCHQSGHNKRRCPLLNPVSPDQSPVAEEDQPDPVPVAEEEVEADHEEADHEADPDLVPVEEEADYVGVSKRRRPSERITKIKLRKNVVTPDGSGGSNDNPVNLN
ncbi:hypothetical protein LXL04_000740 [Taraxacum kok-saghyz]